MRLKILQMAKKTLKVNLLGALRDNRVPWETGHARNSLMKRQTLSLSRKGNYFKIFLERRRN